MKLRFALLAFAVLIPVGGVLLLADEPPAATQPSETPAAKTEQPSPGSSSLGDQAGGLLRVVCTPESGLASPVLIQSLLQNPEFLAELIQEAKLTRSAAGTLPVFSIFETFGSAPVGELPAGICELQIAVLSRDANLPPGKLLDFLPAALVKKLMWLDHDFQPTRVRLELVKREIANATVELDKQNQRWESRSKLLGFQPMDANLALELATQSLGAKVSVQALHRRIAILQEQIAEVAKQVDDMANADPALKELEMNAELQLKKLEIVREVSQGNNREQRGKLLDAEMSVAMARADVAKYRRSLIDSAGGGRLVALQQQLSSARVDLGEQEARERELEQQVGSNYAYEPPQLKQMRLEIEVRERQFVEFMEEARELQRKLTFYRQPSAIVIRR